MLLVEMLLNRALFFMINPGINPFCFDNYDKKPFIPHDLPPSNLDWEKLAPIISKATLELARYDGTLNRIVNPEILLSSITNREAILSSQIEGTLTTEVVLGIWTGRYATICDQRRVLDYESTRKSHPASFKAKVAMYCAPGGRADLGAGVKIWRACHRHSPLET